jgi:2'-5' RNA ligase
MRANWFIAFPVEGSFLLELPEPPRSFRRFHPDDVHLTLAFLGGCSGLAAERAWQALEIGLTELAPRALDVSLGAVAAMGPKQRYSALSALLAGGRLETAACISALRDPVSQAAIARRDERPPKPHITLARPLRQASDQDRERGLEWARTLDLTGIARRLDRIALYTWSEDRRERLFRIVAERALRT